MCRCTKRPCGNRNCHFYGGRSSASSSFSYSGTSSSSIFAPSFSSIKSFDQEERRLIADIVRRNKEDLEEIRRQEESRRQQELERQRVIEKEKAEREKQRLELERKERQRVIEAAREKQRLRDEEAAREKQRLRALEEAARRQAELRRRSQERHLGLDQAVDRLIEGLGNTSLLGSPTRVALPLESPGSRVTTTHHGALETAASAPSFIGSLDNMRAPSAPLIPHRTVDRQVLNFLCIFEFSADPHPAGSKVERVTRSLMDECGLTETPRHGDNQTVSFEKAVTSAIWTKFSLDHGVVPPRARFMSTDFSKAICLLDRCARCFSTASPSSGSTTSKQIVRLTLGCANNKLAGPTETFYREFEGLLFSAAECEQVFKSILEYLDVSVERSDAESDTTL